MYKINGEYGNTFELPTHIIFQLPVHASLDLSLESLTVLSL